MESATIERTEDRPMQVVLKMDETTRGQLRQAETIMQLAEAHVITDAQSAGLANEELQSVKQRKRQIEELRKGFVAPAQQIIENARALFNPALGALEGAEKLLKDRLLGWTRSEEERVAKERREREAEERKRRQEAEQRAAAERAKAAEEARRRREEAERAERERQEAEARARAAREAGDRAATAEAERKAKAAAAEAAKKEEAERIAREEGERRAQEATLAAAATTSAAPEPTAAYAPKGFGAKKNWIAEFKQGETNASVAEKLVCAIAGVERLNGQRALLSLLRVDEKAATKLAKALESNFNVPGMTARDNPIASSRRA